jgi:DNA-binding CsgD family transcriptional regulator
VDGTCERFLLELFGGTAIIDRTLRFTAVNETFAAMSGVPAAVHVGKTLEEIVGSGAGTLRPVIQAVFATGQKARRVRFIARFPNGRLEACWASDCLPITSDGGEVTKVAAIVTEALDQERIEQELACVRESICLLSDCVRHYLQISGTVECGRNREIHSREPELFPLQETDPLTRDNAYKLAPRVNDTFRLLASGQSIKEIAATLGISVKTVQTYRQRGMVKLNLHSNADIVRYAIRNKLIPL